jgi:hypothetical protein
MRHPIYIVGQVYRVPHVILLVFNTILYENEFQNPQVFHQYLRFSPEPSTLVIYKNRVSTFSYCSYRNNFKRASRNLLV